MKYSNAWYWDGSLRDIYVLSVAIYDWQRLIDWLHTGLYPAAFYSDDQPSSLPHDISTIFERRNEHGILLAVDVEGVLVHCHFFRHKEIEFDIDPREVDSEQREAAIVEFMRALGKLLNKAVILTPENDPGTAILTYSPERDEIMHNSASFEPGEAVAMSREEGLRLMARVYGVDETDEAAVIAKMLEAANKPARGDS